MAQINKIWTTNSTLVINYIRKEEQMRQATNSTQKIHYIKAIEINFPHKNKLRTVKDFTQKISNTTRLTEEKVRQATNSTLKIHYIREQDNNFTDNNKLRKIKDFTQKISKTTRLTEVKVRRSGIFLYHLGVFKILLSTILGEAPFKVTIMQRFKATNFFNLNRNIIPVKKHSLIKINWRSLNY